MFFFSVETFSKRNTRQKVSFCNFPKIQNRLRMEKFIENVGKTTENRAKYSRKHSGIVII